MNNESEKIKIYSFSEIASKVIGYCNKINPVLRGDGEGRDNSVIDIIDQLIQYLKELKIDSYYFTYGANQAAQNLSKNVCKKLLGKMEDFFNQEEQNVETEKRDDAFIVYYLEAYLYRLHYPEKLSKFLENYEKFFLNHYAITYQIRGRELRAKGMFKDAIENDELALNILEKKGIENIGIKVTYAASIAVALENRVKGIEQSKIQDSIDIVNQAIQMNRVYPRYYFLNAKIKLYKIKNAVYDTNYMTMSFENWSKIKDAWNKELTEAIVSIENALNLLKENERAESYNIFLSTYNLIRDDIKKLQSEIDLLGAIYGQMQQFKTHVLEEIQKLEEEWNEDNKQKVEDSLKKKEEEINKNNKYTLATIQKEFEKKIQDILQNSQNRYLEILAVFVAIVGVMITSIGLVTNNFSFREVIYGIIVMNAGILAVYTCFKMILSKQIRQLYLVILGITCTIILFSLILGDCQIWINFFGG